MDKTAIYLEDLYRTTIDVTGAKHVLPQTTRFASMKVTVIVVLQIKGDGSKITPLVILKRKDIQKNTEYRLIIKARLR
jgi:hypothetical protein